jgi:hypothetical protein
VVTEPTGNVDRGQGCRGLQVGVERSKSRHSQFLF